uniref:A disintegrin and metalloproteinase with thrombospondin motifs 7-like n=1 Tax=Mastacembelus armatus TaxID=205130 RepID=A0A7N8Y593_9TELE
LPCRSSLFGVNVETSPSCLFLQDLPPYEVVHPTRVDAKGRFLSNFLSHHARRKQRREASEQPTDLDRVFYQLWLGSHSLHFNLTLNPYLLAPGFLTETRYGGIEGVQIRPPGSSQCHFLGEVWDERTVKGNAAISTCEGLTGLFKFSDEEFFIQPLEKSSDETSAPQAHAIYKRHVSPPSWTVNGTCGVKSYEVDERRRERWEQRQRRRSRKIRRRSVSKEKWVETLVVADPKMVEYHGSKAVESYVLAVMNIVSGLFQHPSIGNAINIVVVRLILLEQDEDDLKITHHADNSLNSFCKWQKKLNMKGDEHPLHHDVAVLLTRKDICAAVNMPCETLGLSHVAGMCQPHRSCSINEDTGLPLAFTVAHELGHNFGIQHDGSGNDCEPIGKQPFVMSPQLLYATSQPRWSRCSRQHITRFLDRGWGWCLDDAPVKEKLSLNPVLPGVLYSAAHQCRLQYGSGSLLCDDMENVCSTLWCTVGTTCHSKLDGAVDGTSCGEGRWCFSGECVAVGYQPKSINGGWASWSEWSACSRTCGAGVQSAQRECDNPVPKYRGKYCLGERQRYRICNTTPCPRDLPMFRDVQCSHFNTMPYKGKLYKWEVVINTAVNPCELHCRPLNEHFSEKLRDAVIDGTPCFEGNKSRDMCINGICKSVGCDYVIDSSAVEDQCGVCRGNGSTCMTVRRTFEKREGLGYVDIGLIPEGAWHIRIEEVAEAGNFLALQSDNLKYFLNGGWTIQWNGDYKAAGTVFTYVRTGHLETLMSPGPTMEPLWIQLLFQETNPGVWFEYTISRNVSDNNTIDESVFFWKYGSWTECSVTCGTGFQKQIIHCVEKTTGIVEESFCDPLTRPDDSQTSCNKDPCPAIWSVGEWGKCSASCGSSGLTQRTVLCIRAASVEEQKVLQPSECEHIPKPETLSSCSTHIPCPADWTTGSWSKCSLTCGSGARHRNVTCSRNTGVDCDPQKKPPAVTTCHIQDCPKVVDNFGDGDWSGRPVKHMESPTPTVPISSTYPPFLWPFPVPTSAPTSASTQVTAAYWVTGNWSTVSFFMQMKYLVVVPTHIYLNYLETPIDLELMQFVLIACAVAVYASTSQYTQCKESSSLSFYFCGQCSTSCGLGAVWRTSVCSTGSDSDCDPVKRPAPAQQCYLRPCSTWKVGEWSKCSKNCDSGIKSREAQCFDMRDQRPLRPFHCRAMSSRPQTQIPCNLQPCLTWLHVPAQCSEVCGGGEQQRIVTCPEEDQCDRDLQPSSIQACNTQPCVQWLTGSWGECSASCGGGVQRRLIKCVNTKAEVDEEVDQAQCHHEPQPESTQKCNLQECESTASGDRSKFIFDFDVCVSLKMMTRKGSNFALLVYFGCRRCLKFTILFFLEGRVFCSAL